MSYYIMIYLFLLNVNFVSLKFLNFFSISFLSLMFRTFELPWSWWKIWPSCPVFETWKTWWEHVPYEVWWIRRQPIPVSDHSKNKWGNYCNLSIQSVWGMMSWWSASLTPEWAVLIQALAGDIVLCSLARHSTRTVPLHPGVQMVTGEFNGRGNTLMD